MYKSNKHIVLVFARNIHLSIGCWVNNDLGKRLFKDNNSLLFNEKIKCINCYL